MRNPPHIPDDNYILLLRKLDEFARKYYLNKVIRGAFLSLTLSATYFLLIALAEYVGRFNEAGRTLLFYSFVLLNLAVLAYYILLPLLRYYNLGARISHKQAARLIGQHFPHVRDTLLNTLQLKELEAESKRKALIRASIDQKIAHLRPVPFTDVIDFSQNRHYLRYAAIPLLLMGMLLLLAPAVITDTAFRIVHHQTYFEEPRPFEFRIQNEQLQAIQYEDYKLTVKVEGEALPDQVYLVRDDDNRYLMKKAGKTRFHYTFKNLQQSQHFRLFGSGIFSRPYELQVVPKPMITHFEVSLDYPRYTGRKSEKLNNVGDLVVPAGTRIHWRFIVENVDALFIGHQQEWHRIEKTGKNAFKYRMEPLEDMTYTLAPINRQAPRSDSIQYYLSVVPDHPPKISVESYEDTINKDHIFFNGEISDDYGFQKLAFKYYVTTKGKENRDVRDTAFKEVTIPIAAKNTRQPFFYTWKLRPMELAPGEQVVYFFEVWDNDAVNGSKSARTSKMYLHTPTRKELKQMADQTAASIEQQLSGTKQEAGAINRKMEELRGRFLQKKNLSWEDRQVLRDMMEKQQALQKKMEKMKKDKDKLHKQQDDLMDKDEDLKEKEAQLDQLFEEMENNEELEKLLKELQELLEKGDREEIMEQMQEIQQQNQQQEMKMDRVLELYRQFQFEMQLKQNIAELEHMGEKQRDLQEETIQQEEEVPEALQQEQEALSEQFEEFEKDMEKLKEINEQLEKPHELNDTEQKQSDIKQQMQQSMEKMQQMKPQDAGEHQQEAGDKMEALSQELKDQLNEMQMDQIMLNLQTTRQLLDNLVKLSHRQESLMEELREVNKNSPNYVELMRRQHEIGEDMEMVKDSLHALSKRAFMIQSFVNEEVARIDDNMSKSVDAMIEREKHHARARQQYTMTSMNNLAVMLSEVLDNLQQKLAMQMQGNQQCQNPGGGASQQLSQKQQQLNEQMRGLYEKLQEGEGSSQGEQGEQQELNEELARLAKEQAQLRQAVQRMKEDAQKEGHGEGGDMEQLAEEMDRSERDIVKQELDHETLERQQRILTRLLKAEKSMREREQSPERRAEKPADYDYEEPPAFEQYKEMKARQLELYETVPPSLRPYYRQLVESYFQQINP